MDSIDELKVYNLFVETLQKSLSDLRTIHNIYSESNLPAILDKYSLTLASKLESSLELFLIENSYVS